MKTTASFDAWFAWAAAVLISAACTVLVALAAGDLGWSWRLLLGAGLAADWLVLGLLYPSRRAAPTVS